MTSPRRTRAILDAMAFNRKGIGGRGRRIDDDDETVILKLRIPSALKDRLASVTDNVSEFVRDLIERAVEREEKKQRKSNSP